MAVPDAQQLKRHAVERFRSFRIVLPTVVQQSGNGGTPLPPRRQGPMQGSMQSSRPQRGTPQTVPPALFVAASDDMRDVNAQRDRTGTFDSFFERLCGAVAGAWRTWQDTCTMVGVVINGPVAVGGQVVGPPLAALIQAQAPRGNDYERSRSDAVAEAISSAWLAYTATLRIPGLPLFPSFASMPSPMAPPTPSIPTQVRVLCGLLPLVAEAGLKQRMLARCSAREEYAEQFFDAMAFALASGARYWADTTLVTNIMGTGPVPTFAPPYVPVGPVVGGVGNMLPGGFR